jgi:two-component system sensor histidine kinase KdpD
VSLPAGGEIVAGRFDFTQSLRVLVNLLENALKYGGENRIELQVRLDGDWLVFDAMDRGPGIAPEDADRVFQPFVRAAGVSPDVRGAGLGLAIARGLAEAQGGALDYRPRPGGGSVFSLRLPAARLPQLNEISS